MFALLVFVAAGIWNFFRPIEKTFDVRADGNVEFLVDVKQPLALEAVTALVHQYDGTISPAFPGIEFPDDTFLDEYFLVDIPSQYGFMLRFIKRALSESGLFDDVEYNDAVFAAPLNGIGESPAFDFGVNDPASGEQWALEALGGRSWFRFIENAPKPKKTALLAILDTGIDAAHEDLNGLVSGPENALSDRNSHGTHVAGIAGAITGNGKGIASLPARKGLVRLHAQKVLSDAGSGTEAGIINGILAAADAGADVISMSLGGPTRDSYQRAVEEAVAYANRRGAIVIVAAGNNSADAARYVPANANGVITVTALQQNGTRADFSNTVQNIRLPLAAPGKDILSSVPGNSYASYSGTSMATPYVASIAAILKAYNPALTTQQLWELLASTGGDTAELSRTGKSIRPENALKKLLTQKILPL
jgi:thermitase